MKELPLSLIASVERKLVTAVAVTNSPFSGGQFVQDWGGAWWAFSIDFAIHTAAEGRLMSAFWSSIGGRRDAFLLRDPSIQQVTMGAPRVNGAGQSGSFLATSGWTPNATVLRAGDFIQLGTEAETRLHHVLGDVVASAAGLATIEIAPKLRTAPAHNSIIVVTAPAVQLRLNEVPPSVIKGAARHQFSITATEAL